MVAPKTKSIKKSFKKISKCPHATQEYYAAGMCKNCYHAKGRTKLAAKCDHPERALYAKGQCRNCYLSIYHKAKRIDMKKKSSSGTI
jgi:hypothetical protein